MVVSKFRTLFIYREIFMIALGFLVIGVLLYNATENQELIYDSTPFLLAVIMFALLIFGVSRYFYISRISISEKGILTRNIITKKEKLILYNDILRIRLKRSVAEDAETKYNNGYLVRQFELTDNTTMKITADLYENYNELVSEINFYKNKCVTS